MDIFCLIASFLFAGLGYIYLSIHDTAEDLLTNYLISDGYVLVSLRKAKRLKKKLGRSNFHNGRRWYYRFDKEVLIKLRPDEFFSFYFSDVSEFWGYAFLFFSFVFASIAVGRNSYDSHFVFGMFYIPMVFTGVLLFKFRLAHKNQIRKDFYNFLNNPPEISDEKIDFEFQHLSADDKHDIELYPHLFDGRDSYYQKLFAFNVHCRFFHPLYGRLALGERYQDF